MKVKVRDGVGADRRLQLWCPGCDALHEVNFSQWTVDLTRGSDKVTVDPSIKTEWSGPNGTTVCHSWLRDGVWTFLKDSTHQLAGHQADLLDLPSWLVGEGPVPGDPVVWIYHDLNRLMDEGVLGREVYNQLFDSASQSLRDEATRVLTEAENRVRAGRSCGSGPNHDGCYVSNALQQISLVRAEVADD